MKRTLLYLLLAVSLLLNGKYLFNKFYFQPPVTIKDPIKDNPFYTILTQGFKNVNIDSASIIFIGDSQTQFFPLNEIFNNPNIKNLGIAGDVSEGVLNRVDQIGQPGKVFLQIGINDLLSGVSPDTVIFNIAATIKRINTTSPKTKIFIQSVFPCSYKLNTSSKTVSALVSILNERIRSFCATSGCVYLDLFDTLGNSAGLYPKYDCGDHLHLNADGYKAWSTVIQSCLQIP